MKPQRSIDRIQTLVDVWTKLRPTKSFYGLTLDEFKAAIQPSLGARLEVAQLEIDRSAAIVRRATADEQTLALVQRIVEAVVADKDEGSDGEFYKALGYVRRSERATGLTRRNRKAANVVDLSKAA
jgi:hypothetical protein